MLMLMAYSMNSDNIYSLKHLVAQPVSFQRKTEANLKAVCRMQTSANATLLEINI